MSPRIDGNTVRMWSADFGERAQRGSVYAKRTHDAGLGGDIESPPRGVPGKDVRVIAHAVRGPARCRSTSEQR